MIVSHRRRFVFVKTQKTAGTSLELALSRYCGPEDVVTPVMKREERLRTELGFLPPRNFLLPWGEHRPRDVAHLLHRGRRRRKFYSHLRADVARDALGEEVWNSYFKFCFERNPWDKVVSGYHFFHALGAIAEPIED